MDLRSINNFFGDMDLILMDWILKGKVPADARVLDVGCGEGRNAIFFIQNGYDYSGIDPDESKIQLIKYLSKQGGHAKASFIVSKLEDYQDPEPFDFIICSRLLHFSKNEQQFFESISKLKELLSVQGLLYLSMDSVLETQIGKPLADGHVEFPDGNIRFPLDNQRYKKMIKLFSEEEPTRTIIHHDQRAQSFLLLKNL